MTTHREIPDEVVLLPCPFCGEHGVTVIEGSTFRWMFAACDHCGASVSEVRVQTIGYGTREEWAAAGKAEALAAWNTRAVAPMLRGDANRLAEAYEAGWIEASRWANRQDLVSDIPSPAYKRDRDASLARYGLAQHESPPTAHGAKE